MTPHRLVPLLAQFDFARQRLHDRLAGPTVDSGNGSPVPVEPMTDAEYFWEPAPGCLSVRRRADGPGPAAKALVGAGEWARDSLAGAQPVPQPLTTIAWRLAHLGEQLTLRADHTTGTHTLTRHDYLVSGDAKSAIADFDTAAQAWRDAVAAADDTALDTVGHSTYPDGSDPEDAFLHVVWWVNQELLHHGAEIALLRDLYGVRPTASG